MMTHMTLLTLSVALPLLAAAQKTASPIIVLLLASALSLRAVESVIPARDKYLLLDARIIERTENAELRLGTVSKHTQNPILKEDKPWEVRFDNLYPNVLFDESEQIYRCWYSPFIVDAATTETPAASRAIVGYKPHDREMGVCYATSHDGLTWEKPALGLIEFNGSTANNLVMRLPHGSGVFRDASDPDASRRFKLFARASDSIEQMAVAFSPDGLLWNTPVLCQEIKVPGDTHNNAFLSPESGKYVGITRILWSPKSGKPIGTTGITTHEARTVERVVARTESTDFVHWTEAVEVLRGDPINQIYAMPVFRHADVYLGLLAIFNTKTDRVHCELAWSPDTIAWHRIQPGMPLIPTSANRSDYDWGCVYPAATPVILEDEIRLYYGASNGPHTNWRDGFLALATLRPDGFAGYTPKDDTQPAVIVTHPLNVNGRTLRITADVNAGGWVKATLLDATEKMLAEGRPVTATTTSGHAIDTPQAQGQTVRVRLEMQNAKVFSFAFEP